MNSVISQGLPLLAHALVAVGYFKYPLLFIGAIVEGPILTIAAGFLLHTGIFSVLPLYIALGTGDLAGDAIWYAIGRYFAAPVLARHGRFLALTPALFEKIKARFHKNKSTILFTSKIMMGFGMALAMLTAAGAAEIPFGDFLFWNSLGEIIYIAALLAIGYFFGQLYGSIAGGLKILFGLGGAVLLIAGVFLFSNYLRHRAEA